MEGCSNKPTSSCNRITLHEFRFKPLLTVSQGIITSFESLSHKGLHSKIVLYFSGAESVPKLTEPCLVIHYNNKNCYPQVINSYSVKEWV